LLGIFLGVAIVVVGRIQHGLSQAQASKREATLMYELSVVLAGAHTREDVTRTLARQLQQFYQAELIQVSVEGKDGPAVVDIPNGLPWQGNRISFSLLWRQKGWSARSVCGEMGSR